MIAVNSLDTFVDVDLVVGAETRHIELGPWGVSIQCCSPPGHARLKTSTRVGAKTDDCSENADFSVAVKWTASPVAISPAINSWHDTSLGASGNPKHDNVYPPSTFDIVEPIKTARRQLRAPYVRLWSGTSYVYRWPNSTRVTPVGPAISPPNTTETCRLNFPNCSCCREYCAVGCPCCQVPPTTSWDFRALDINVASLQSSTAFPETNILQIVVRLKSTGTT